MEKDSSIAVYPLLIVYGAGTMISIQSSVSGNSLFEVASEATSMIISRDVWGVILLTAKVLGSVFGLSNSFTDVLTGLVRALR